MAPAPSWKSLAVASLLGSYSLANWQAQYAPARSTVKSFLIVFPALFLVNWIWYAIVWPKLFSPLRHLPHAPLDNATFCHGHFWAVMKEKTGLPMRRWINEVPNDGLIRYTMFNNAERVLLTSPKAIGEVLVQNSYDYVKPALARQALGRLLGVGVLLAEGDEHKVQRKNLLPAFAFRHVKNLVPTFWSKSSEMCQAVSEQIRETQANSEDKSEGIVIEFGGWLNRTTLDIIGIAGMGFDFGAIKDPDSDLNVTYRSVFTPSRQAKLLGFLGLIIPLPLLRLLPIKRNADVAYAAKKIRDTSRDLIVRKQEKMATKQNTDEKDILSVALESGAFSVDNLVDQTMTFLAAGHETTATAMQWALIELGKNPEIQCRLREEIRQKLPSLDEDATMTSEMIDQLPYLNAVCNEVLRFWPPVPLTRREAIKDVVILGQFVPKGTDVILCSYAINFSKELWGEDADVFNPDRWMGEKRANNGGADSAYSNLTFLHGPRGCIGQSFAKAEFNCLLAAVVGRFDMELEPKDRVIELETGIVTRPKGGLKLRMKVVKGW